MVEIKSIPMNKATLSMAALIDCIIAGVYFVWAIISLGVVHGSSSGSAHNAMIGILITIGVVAFIMMTLSLIVLVNTRTLTSQNNFIIMLVCLIVSLVTIFISFFCAKFTIVTAFIMSIFTVVGVVVLRIFVGKFMNDVVVKNPNEEATIGDESSSAYQPPAAVDSEADPSISAVDSAAII